MHNVIDLDYNAYMLIRVAILPLVIDY